MYLNTLKNLYTKTVSGEVKYLDTGFEDCSEDDDYTLAPGETFDGKKYCVMTHITGTYGTGDFCKEYSYEGVILTQIHIIGNNITGCTINGIKS